MVALAVPATISPNGKVAKDGSEDILEDAIEPINTIIGAEAEINGPAKNKTIILLGKPEYLRTNNATIIKAVNTSISGKAICIRLFN
jgi:hypothetical protein